MDDKSRIAEVRINPGTAFPGDIADDVVYILEDQIGSSVARLSTSGTIIDEEEYYPFGDSSLRTFTYKRYRYVGKEKDAESGLYYYGARYYAAWTCRFISVDPLAGDYPFYTPYNYAGNKPIGKIDIDGMQEGNKDGNGTAKQVPNSGNSTPNQALQPIPESKKIACHQADQVKSDQVKSVKDLISNLKPTSNILSKEDSTKIRDWTKDNASSPQDIVLEEMKALVDKNIPYSLSGNRTDLSEDGLAKLDCSETVSVYLKKLDVMAAGKESLYTGVMINEASIRNAIGSVNISFVEGSDSSDFTPQKGDIFVWRNNGEGHTGIVYGVDGEKVTILEAIGKSGSAAEAYNKNNGGSTTTNTSRTAVYDKSGKALAGHAGWVGYFRPLTN